MPKLITYLLIFSILFSSFSPILTARVLAVSTDDDIPDGTVEEPSQEDFGDLAADSAAIAACSTGLGNFLSDMISKISSALKCLPFSSILGSDAGTKCTVSAGGTDTTQKCREWVRDKLVSIKKYKAQLLKILIATMVRRLVDNMAMDIIDWVGGKTTGEPQFVTNWNDFINESVNEAVGDTIEATGKLSFLCSPFKAQIVMNLASPNQQLPLPYCTLNTVISNIENFYDNFTSGGWLAFNEIVKPQNNPQGALLMEMEYLQKKADDVQYAKEQETQSGFVPAKACRLLMTDPETGEETCLEYAISIPSQTVSDMTSKSATTQIDNADKYMITENDLLNYGQLILNAIVNRVVTSAKQNIFGGKSYGEGLLNFPEQAEEDPNMKYSCVKSGDFSACIPDEKGEFTTKEECQASCSVKYRCDSELFICIADENGIYDSEEACEEKCISSSNNFPSCLACTKKYVRGRGPADSQERKCTGVDGNCNICAGTISGSVCSAFCLHVKGSLWGGKGQPAEKTFSKSFGDFVGWEKLFTHFGAAVPDSCLCKRPIEANDFGIGYDEAGKDYCYNCIVANTDLEWSPSVCTGSSWCDKNCDGINPKPTPSVDSSDWPYPNCNACIAGVFVRGRGTPGSTNAKGACSSENDADCNLCSSVSSGSAGGGGGLLCQTFCEATREEAWGGKTGVSPRTFTKKEIEDSGYDLIWKVGGDSVPSTCTCSYANNYKKLNEFSFGGGYTHDNSICYNCTKLPQTAKDLSIWEENAAEPRWVCDNSQWCNKYCCPGCPTPPPHETL